MLEAVNEVLFWSRCWRKLSTVGGSCIQWAGVALWTVNGSSFACYPYRTPPYLVNVKINFDEVQKLTRKEITCLYSLIKIITSNHIYNLWCFFVWYVITCHLTTYRVSRNRFSTINFHDYLHCCGIPARFLVTIVLNIISSLHIAFSLCARVGWCDVCTVFTNLIKLDVDINEMSLLNI